MAAVQRHLAAVLVISVASVMGLPSERLSRLHMAHLSLRLRGGGGGGGGGERRTGASSGHLWSEASLKRSLFAKGADSR